MGLMKAKVDRRDKRRVLMNLRTNNFDCADVVDLVRWYDDAIDRIGTFEAEKSEMIASQVSIIAAVGERFDIAKKKIAADLTAALARAEAAEATILELRRALADVGELRGAVVDVYRRAETAEAALAQCQRDLATMIERKEYFRQCWEVAEAALAERDRPCVWTMENGVWYTGCGHEAFLLASECCPHCPRRIERQWYGEEAQP